MLKESKVPQDCHRLPLQARGSNRFLCKALRSRESRDGKQRLKWEEIVFDFTFRWISRATSFILACAPIGLGLFATSFARYIPSLLYYSESRSVLA